MKEKLLKIINNYGILPQLKYFQSEVFELSESIITYENWYGDCCTSKEMLENKREHITEEISDCYVMLEQFKLYYEITDEEVQKIMEEKVERQLSRIREERESDK